MPDTYPMEETEDGGISLPGDKPLAEPANVGGVAPEPPDAPEDATTPHPLEEPGPGSTTAAEVRGRYPLGSAGNPYPGDEPEPEPEPEKASTAGADDEPEAVPVMDAGDDKPKRGRFRNAK